MDRICALFRILGDSLHLEETLAGFDSELRRHVPYAALSLHVLEDGRLLPAYASGIEAAALGSLECAAGEGILGRAVESRKPVRNCRPERLGSLGTALVLPLEYDGAVSAVLALFQEGSQEFSDAELDFLIAVAPKLSAAVGNARAFQAIAKLSGMDPLTGALNGRSLFLRLDAELARSRRQRGRLAVLECAIQGLDPSLPEVSRGVLRRIATALRSGCREYDALAYTGEDLVVVLAGCAPAAVAEKRAWIQACVEEVGMSAGLPLAALVGDASFPEDAADTEGLLAIAAQRLQLSRRILTGGTS